MGQAIDHLDQVLSEGSAQKIALKQAALAIRRTIVGRLHDDGLNHHDVQFRVKTAESAAEKMGRRDHNGLLKYPGGLERLDDLIGVRSSCSWNRTLTPWQSHSPASSSATMMKIKPP